MGRTDASMTRRQRILTALKGGVPDRPPFSFDARPEAMEKILAHYDVKDKNDLYVKTGIDGFSVWAWNAVMGRYRYELPVAEDGLTLNFWGGYSQKHFGLGDCDTIEDLERYHWPTADDFDYSHVYSQAQEIEAKDMVVAAGHIGLGYQMHNELRSNIKALLDVTDPDYMRVYTHKVLDFTLGYLERLLQAGRGQIEVVRADDDVGTQNRLMISPEAWRSYYKPSWKKAFDLVHDYGAKIWFHSCGYIRPLLDDLVEIGIDVWNPFPNYVAGNDHQWLREWRRERGLALDGGVNHYILVDGTPQDVVEETKRVLDMFAPDGGLLIGPSQVFTEDMPVENMAAFFDTVLEY